MTGFLRFVGLLNAAVWCGSAIFIIVGIPALFSSETARTLTQWGAGTAAEAVLGRFFILQYWCGGIALTHLVSEWLYLGRPLWRFNLALVAGLIFLNLVGGLWVQPKLRNLHYAKYFGKTMEQREQADRTFKFWHGWSEGANLLVIAGLVVYLWETASTTEGARFVNYNKIRC